MVEKIINAMKEENFLTNASLSTMWAVKNFPDLNDFFAIAKRLGFQKIELNHQVNSVMLSHVTFDHIQFSSVHEPCPADIPTKKLVERDWLISSHDEQSRKQGVDTVKRSIELAHKLSAPTVVIHCGNVNSNAALENKLRALYDTGRNQSDEYQEIKEILKHSRAEIAGPRMKAVKKSLMELVDYAERYNVQLGLENRYHYMDIPSIDEIGELLNLADDDQLGFVYDVGHAQALDLLGFYPHEEWLMRFASRMFGVHLHDVIGLTDHYAPGLGDIDFKMIAKYLPENSFRTCELLPSNTPEQVKNGVKKLVDNGCIKYL
jgi:sugar phosphate isomerase/epimerase